MDPKEIPTREYCGQQVPTLCILCEGKLDWEAAESSTSDSVVMAEGYNPVGWDQHCAKFIGRQLTSHDGLTVAYDSWAEMGNAGVVHGVCLVDHGWEIS